jgi:hypothetical protein
MTNSGKPYLIAAGAASAASGVLHLVCIAIGGPAYRYFGAGETFARRAEAGSLQPAMMTLVIAMAFFVLAAYGFAGAGLIRRLPLTRTALVACAVVYLLRGLSVIPETLAVHAGRIIPPRYLVFSLVSLAVGICYALGTIGAWSRLRTRRDAPEGGA